MTKHSVGYTLDVAGRSQIPTEDSQPSLSGGGREWLLDEQGRDPHREFMAPLHEITENTPG